LILEEKVKQIIDRQKGKNQKSAVGCAKVLVCSSLGTHCLL
jgi:hypothetical protein